MLGKDSVIEGKNKENRGPIVLHSSKDYKMRKTNYLIFFMILLSEGKFPTLHLDSSLS